VRWRDQQRATGSDPIGPGRQWPSPSRGRPLLLIDVINDLAFQGSAALVAQAEPMASRLATLKRRASAAGVPTIYINDNFGQWRSDFRKTVAHCTSRSSPGRRVSQRLKPTSRDYFVLKPNHSGFFDTTLDTLLETLRIPRGIRSAPITALRSKTGRETTVYTFTRGYAAAPRSPNSDGCEPAI
jgi:nicotinamidase-related amidase